MTSRPGEDVLEIIGMTVTYGGIRALSDVSLSVKSGTVVALLGANGAGKSTCVRTTMGLVRQKHGRIIFGGEDITRVPSHKRFRAGLALVPEGRRVVASFTVEENLRVGGMYKNAEGSLDGVLELFPRLRERMAVDAGLLSGGEQQMLAIARALLSGPKMLLLDEPSMGLAPIVIEEVFDVIARLRSQGTSMLLVEQNAQKAFQVADFAYVLERGEVVRAGTVEELRDDPMVADAYLGGGVATERA